MHIHEKFLKFRSVQTEHNIGETAEKVSVDQVGTVHLSSVDTQKYNVCMITPETLRVCREESQAQVCTQEASSRSGLTM